MKAFILLFAATLTTSVFAHPNLTRSECAAYVIKAQEEHDLLKNGLNAGVTNVIDFGYAELNLLDAQFDCRAISFDDYCAEAPVVAKNLEINIEAEVKVGSRDPKETIKIKRAAAALEKFCR